MSWVIKLIFEQLVEALSLQVQPLYSPSFLICKSEYDHMVLSRSGFLRSFFYFKLHKSIKTFSNRIFLSSEEELQITWEKRTYRGTTMFESELCWQSTYIYQLNRSRLRELGSSMKEPIHPSNSHS